MIAEVLLAAFSIIFAAYLIRHLVFVGAVALKGNGVDFQSHAGLFFPIRHYHHSSKKRGTVIGRLLSRITVFTYPKEKLNVIVVDDNSTDSTGQIAEDFARQYPHFSGIHRPEGRGKVSCRKCCSEHRYCRTRSSFRR